MQKLKLHLLSAKKAFSHHFDWLKNTKNSVFFERRCTLETSCSPHLSPRRLNIFLGSLSLKVNYPAEFGQNPRYVFFFRSTLMYIPTPFPLPYIQKPAKNPKPTTHQSIFHQRDNPFGKFVQSYGDSRTSIYYFLRNYTNEEIVNQTLLLTVTTSCVLFYQHTFIYLDGSYAV